jgi:hypothetical protein
MLVSPSCFDEKFMDKLTELISYFEEKFVDKLTGGNF